MLDTIVHRWLRIPYSLHISHQTIQKRAKETVLLIHGIGDTGATWNKLYGRLPDDINVIAVDLLGFGSSPRPSWGVYDARTQAHCLLATYLRLRIHGQVSIVGHSLGSLVAIDFARRYPLLVRKLILCAPPIYQPSSDKKTRDERLRRLYAISIKKPDLLIKLYGLGQKIRLLGPSMQVTEDNAPMFVRTLQASIINQRTVDDIAKVKKPITIVHGIFDAFVVRSNLTSLRSTYSNIKLVEIAAGHNLSEAYIKEIVAALAGQPVIPSAKTSSVPQSV